MDQKRVNAAARKLVKIMNAAVRFSESSYPRELHHADDPERMMVVGLVGPGISLESLVGPMKELRTALRAKPKSK